MREGGPGREIESNDFEEASMWSTSANIRKLMVARTALKYFKLSFPVIALSHLTTFHLVSQVSQVSLSE